jgi:hypothetical protein
MKCAPVAEEFMKLKDKCRLLSVTSACLVSQTKKGSLNIEILQGLLKFHYIHIRIERARFIRSDQTCTSMT